VLLVLLALLVTVTGFAAGWSGRAVLVLGVDRREGDRGRSDTMLLVVPRVFGGGLKLLSIPRDTRVELPGRGTAKINAAYAFDGPEASAQAVARLLDIPVPTTVVVDFTAVAAVVDAMGGVTLTIERPMRYRDPYQDLVIDLDAGTRRLDGEEALGYVRFRSDAQGDIGRTARQRVFVQAVLSQLLAPGGWRHLPAVYGAIRAHAETEMGPAALLGFGLSTALSALWGVEEAVVPGRTATVDGASYWLHDPEETAALVDRWFGRWAFGRPAGRLPAAGGLLNQGPRVRPYVARYLELLQAGDAGALARFLTVDDLDYPVDLARQAIDRCAAETAVETLAFEYNGFGPLQYREGQVTGPSIFRFTITGRTPDGQALAHPIRLVIGDGLISLDDPWVPRLEPQRGWGTAPGAARRGRTRGGAVRAGAALRSPVRGRGPHGGRSQPDVPLADPGRDPQPGGGRLRAPARHAHGRRSLRRGRIPG